MIYHIIDHTQLSFRLMHLIYSIGQCNTRVCPQNLNSPECEQLQWPKIWRCFEASSIISMQDLSFVIYTAAYLFDRVLLHDTCATEIKTYSKSRTQILRKLLSVRSRSSYLLHSCSTGMETSRHCRDPQQN